MSLKFVTTYTARLGLLVLLLSVFSSEETHGQYYSKPYPEWSFGLGASNFLGDLGGRDQIGSDFVWDLEFSRTKPAMKISYMHYVNKWSGIRYNFLWGSIAGDDKLTAEPYRNNRNLHFKSTLLELSAWYEVHLVRDKVAHRHDLKDMRGRMIGLRGGHIGTYLFGGIAGVYFNPKALHNGQWVALAPLGTEGQGLPGGPKAYRRLTVGFPMGFGFRFSRNRRFSLSAELGYRITLSDYLDDVSTSYYDNEALLQARGEASAYLADPSLDTEGTLTWTQEGEQRGDPTDNDGYMFLTISGNYKIKTQRNSRGRRRNVYRAKINRSFRY